MNHILYVTYFRLDHIDSPEVTGTFFLAVPSSTGNVPSSTSDTTASQTIPPEPATGSGSVSSRNIKSNSGAIAGGVFGVALITGLVALFTIHRRRRHALSADHISGRVVPYPIEIERLRLYVSLFFAQPCEGVRDRD